MDYVNAYTQVVNQYARNVIGTSHAKADAFLGKREQKRLAANKILYRSDSGDIHVRLHNTNVVTYHPNGDVTVRTGGWNTPTTARTIEDYTGLPVRRKGGDVHVLDQEVGDELRIPGEAYGFLAKLRAEPNEALHHEAFADFLEERGLTQAAAVHRKHAQKLK